MVDDMDDALDRSRILGDASEDGEEGDVVVDVAQAVAVVAGFQQREVIVLVDIAGQMKGLDDFLGAGFVDAFALLDEVLDAFQQAQRCIRISVPARCADRRSGASSWTASPSRSTGPGKRRLAAACLSAFSLTSIAWPPASRVGRIRVQLRGAHEVDVKGTSILRAVLRWRRCSRAEGRRRSRSRSRNSSGNRRALASRRDTPGHPRARCCAGWCG